MRVLFDAFWWGRGPGANRTVQREIIEAWHALFPNDELILALRRDDNSLDASGLGTVTHTRLWPHAVANRWDLPRIAKQTQPDVIIAHNFAPSRGDSIVFIHDAMFVDHPEWFSRKERAYFSRMIPWSRAATSIATSTNTEARRIDRLIRRDTSPTAAVGLGVPTALMDREARRPARVPAGSSFALTVGRLNVRKNLLAVMRGASVAANVSAESPLVVVGGTAHSGVVTEFPDDVQRAIDERRVILLGSTDDSELAWLYANAALVLSLSLDEGFGLPALEAVSFGAPLLVSDIAVFRETVGGYASFVSPHAEVASIGHAIDTAWGQHPDESERKAVMKRYSWDSAATALRSLAQASRS